jgi:hypothetical protein
LPCGAGHPGTIPQGCRWIWYLYVAIDKFTKWSEATPVVKINKQSTVKFIKSIICRFGVPNWIITNTGSQFTSRVFQEYYEDLGVQICYTSIAHLEINGQVEKANAEILGDLKTRTYDCLKKHSAKWIDELPCTLWSNWTSASQATGETSFFLVYGADAIIPRRPPWSPSVSRHTTKPRRTSSGVMISTSSMSEDGKQLFEMHSTIRRSGAITIGSCIVGSSKWTIWCSGAYSSVKALPPPPRPSLGGSFSGDTSLLPWMRPLGYGGWNVTVKSMEHRAPP